MCMRSVDFYADITSRNVTWSGGWWRWSSPHGICWWVLEENPLYAWPTVALYLLVTEPHSESSCATEQVTARAKDFNCTRNDFFFYMSFRWVFRSHLTPLSYSEVPYAPGTRRRKLAKRKFKWFASDSHQERRRKVSKNLQRELIWRLFLSHWRKVFHWIYKLFRKPNNF